MAYLRHYQMRGDPGLFSSIGKILKGAVGIAAPVLPGVGGVVGRVVSKIGGSRAGKLAGKVVGKIPGGAKGAAIAVGAGAAAAGLGAMAGRMSAGGGGRRYRRMDVGNVKALRRSMRRVTGFAKLARSVMTFTKSHRIKKTRRR